MLALWLCKQKIETLGISAGDCERKDTQPWHSIFFFFLHLMSQRWQSHIFPSLYHALKTELTTGVGPPASLSLGTAARRHPELSITSGRNLNEPVIRQRKGSSSDKDSTGCGRNTAARSIALTLEEENGVNDGEKKKSPASCSVRGMRLVLYKLLSSPEAKYICDVLKKGKREKANRSP